MALLNAANYGDVLVDLIGACRHSMQPTSMLFVSWRNMYFMSSLALSPHSLASDFSFSFSDDALALDVANGGFGGIGGA
jgi:hypothetical protein